MSRASGKKRISTSEKHPLIVENTVWYDSAEPAGSGTLGPQNAVDARGSSIGVKRSEGVMRRVRAGMTENLERRE
jgi:hypothetical protein